MTDCLKGRVAAALNAPVAEPVRRFANRLAAAGDATAVLFYGSNLRTGSLEGVLDFYVLKDGPLESGIWPRVSYHEWDCDGVMLRAKVATMNLATFHAAASGQLLDTTIWARFVQPSALAWSRDVMAADAARTAVAAAAITAARLAAALGPDAASAEHFWRGLFRATYAAEFRVEKAGREESILAANQEHFAGLLPLALTAGKIRFSQAADVLRPQLADQQRAAIISWWRKRQRLGKFYNAIRLLKASTTFEGAGRYAAWKIERHTGIPVAITPWREAHPVLAAPAVLWQIWRAKKA